MLAPSSLPLASAALSRRVGQTQPVAVGSDEGVFQALSYAGCLVSGSSTAPTGGGEGPSGRRGGRYSRVLSRALSTRVFVGHPAGGDRSQIPSPAFVLLAPGRGPLSIRSCHV